VTSEARPELYALGWRSAGSDESAPGDGAESGWRPENLRKPGFSPATVIDVGVAAGTPSLYEAFPDSHHVLIEPLEEYEAGLERWIERHGGEYLLTAVGEAEGSATIAVDVEAPWASSILRTRGGLTRPLRDREVPMTTLDRLLAERGWKPPFGLKIDTEGFEDHVVRGSSKLLERTQFVIAEVSVGRRYEESYTFAQFIALMDSRGFALCDLLDGLKPGPNANVIFVDAMFRPRPDVRRPQTGSRPG
jgi:FkbM family methyltransferase